MKVRKRNPLCYLAVLGIIGFLGLYMMAPAVIVFLLFFFFWGYRNMTPDELFWENVRRAGVRAFAAGMGINVIVTIIIVITNWAHLLGIQKMPEGGMMIANGTVELDMALFSRYVLISNGFVLQMLISLCTFFFTLMYFRKKEEKGAKEEVC